MASINIGETLRAAREQQNISLEELQQLTKIQKRYLVAIEYNDFESMPGTFYVRAFIRQYASAVGLDGQALIDVFNGELNSKSEEPVIQLEQVEKRRRSSAYDEERTNFLRGLPAVMFSLLGLAIAIVVFYITWENRQLGSVIKPHTGIEDISILSSEPLSSSTVESSESTATLSSQEQQNITIAKTSEVADTVEMSVKNIESPVQIQLAGKSVATWVGVLVNGLYVYQGVLQADEFQTIELPAEATNATVIVGVSENITIQLNDQPVEFQTADSDMNRKTVVFNFTYKNTQ